jgi:hypothetical protein
MREDEKTRLLIMLGILQEGIKAVVDGQLYFSNANGTDYL